MNIRPGDFARIIRDPFTETTPDGHSNIGKVVHVQSLHIGATFYVDAMRRRYGPIYDCRPLQPLYVMDFKVYPGILRRYLDMQMSLSLIPGAWLQRIDPPGDVEDIFNTAPLPGEQIKNVAVHNSANARREFIKRRTQTINQDYFNAASQEN